MSPQKDTQEKPQADPRAESRAEPQSAPAEPNAEGLQKEGESYVNDAYGSSDATLDIQGGVGEINLKLV